MYIIAVFAANKNGKRAAKNRIRIRRERTKKKRKTIPKAKKKKQQSKLPAGKAIL
jgi:translation elongation factor P/translation initiation factor 5A